MTAEKFEKNTFDQRKCVVQFRNSVQLQLFLLLALFIIFTRVMGWINLKLSDVEYYGVFCLEIYSPFDYDYLSQKVKIDYR